MRFTRVKTTLMTGMLAASMVMPGMTAYAALGNTAAAVDTLSIDKYVKVANSITVPGTVSFQVERYDANKDTANVYDNGDGTIQPDLKTGVDVKVYPATYSVYGSGVTGQTDAINAGTIAKGSTGYEDNGANKKASTADILTDLKSVCQTNGEYTFKITETGLTAKTDSDKEGWTSIDGTVYYLHVYVTTDNNDELQYQFLATKGTAIDGVNKGDEGFTAKTDSTAAAYQNKVSSLDFNNTYVKRAGSDVPTDSNDPKKGASLVLEKKVDGSATYEPTGTKYKFTVKLNDSNTYETKGKSVTYTIYNSDNTVSSTKTETIPDNCNISLELTSNQYVVFADIPAGVECKVTEEDPQKITNIVNWKNSVVADNGTAVDSQDKDKDTDSFILGENKNEVTFTNTFADVTVTGVVTDIAPYITLVAAAVLAIAAYMGLKNRIAR